jgi:hypothetical protein
MSDDSNQLHSPTDAVTRVLQILRGMYSYSGIIYVFKTV